MSEPYLRPERKRRLHPALIALIAIVCAAGGWLIADRIVESLDTNDAENDLSFQTTSNVVDTDAFRFEMTDDPTTEPLSQTVSGVTVTGDAWRVDVGNDGFVQVMAMQFDTPGADNEAAIAQMVGGMIVRAGGKMGDDEQAHDGDVFSRRTVIDIDGGHMFSQAYAKGAWVVSILTGGPHDDPPSEFTQVVETFAFK